MCLWMHVAFLIQFDSRFMTLVKVILYFFCCWWCKNDSWCLIEFDMWRRDELNTGKRKCNILNWISTYFVLHVHKVELFLLCISVGGGSFGNINIEILLLNVWLAEKKVKNSYIVLSFVMCSALLWISLHNRGRLDMSLKTFQGS